MTTVKDTKSTSGKPVRLSTLVPRVGETHQLTANAKLQVTNLSDLRPIRKADAPCHIHKQEEQRTIDNGYRKSPQLGGLSEYGPAE